MDEQIESKDKTEVKDKDLKNFRVIFIITDIRMKPKHLDFTNTKERVHFEQIVEVLGAESSQDAVLFATMIMARTWKKEHYNIEYIKDEEMVTNE